MNKRSGRKRNRRMYPVHGSRTFRPEMRRQGKGFLVNWATGARVSPRLRAIPPPPASADELLIVVSPSVEADVAAQFGLPQPVEREFPPEMEAEFAKIDKQIARLGETAK